MTSAKPNLSDHAPLVPTLHALAQRWAEYRKTPIDMTISPVDDMRGRGNLDAYRKVGSSALEAISEAMLLARRTNFQTILDLPCGGGRVTRHLVKFFPDSTIHVCDAEKPKEDFVASHFKLPKFQAPIDFAGAPSIRFDLIFVGSLLTHFDRNLFKAALDYFVAALNPNGLLVATLHGRDRANAFVERQRAHAAKSRDGKPSRPELLKDIQEHFFSDGFSFLQRVTVAGIPYGATFSAPSWVMKLAETRSDAKILGLKEAGWAGNQDVLVLKKIATPIAGKV